MRTFAQCGEVEREAWRLLEPHLRAQRHIADIVPLFGRRDNPAVARAQRLGDFVVHLRAGGDPLFVELKGERRPSPNLFVETWSNATFGWQTVGWALGCTADWLAYVFVESGELFWFRFQPMWEWMFRDGNVYRYPEREQRVTVQKNRTMGRLVPIADLKRAGFLRHQTTLTPSSGGRVQAPAGVLAG